MNISPARTAERPAILATAIELSRPTPALRGLCLVLIALLAGIARAGDELPDARAYMDRIEQSVDRLAEQLPEYARAADHIAPTLIPDGRHLGVMGSIGLSNELSHRAGALVLTSGEPGRTGDPVLYVFGVQTVHDPELPELLQQQIDEARQLKGSGPLIGLASFAQLREQGQLDNARDAVDILLDNGADDTDQQTPSHTVLNTLAAWTLQAELFSACVRRDRVPVIVVSPELDRVRQHQAKYAGQRFMHDRWLDPIEPQTLGRAYLDKAKTLIRDVGTASWPSISAASRRAGRAVANGGTLYIVAGPAPASHHLGHQLATDPRVLTPMIRMGRQNQRPGMQDMIIAIGDHRPPGDASWGILSRGSGAGQGVVWIFAGYGLDRSKPPRRDIIIDTWAPVGDAILPIPNLDVRMGPISGVNGELIAWILTAQIPYEIRYLQNRRLNR